ncbi:MAG: Transcriptional regulatory protein DegU [Chroococcidiopsis sp. SAG 2025]|nr:response regulator transcription factor [Chroococcidiopsis sp. SAG 2025]MDV2993955.1 Transcriptional regulatory protein DegU [Chroococcidiopsis sp. SAG 2025]
MNNVKNMSKIRVALIEDHDLTRVGIRTALQQRQELEVVGEAANASEGLQLLQTVHPDIAIVDIGLPDKDGIELTREIKAAASEGEGFTTKVLILTLRDNREAVLAAFAAGADSYCMKDISFDNLLEALRVTHSGNAWIDPAIARIVLQQVKPAPAEVPAAVVAEVSKEDKDSKTVAIHAADEDYDQMLAAYPLTERELEVLQLIVEGCSNAVIAEKLYITVGTVKTHVRNILNKLCADDRTQAAVRALRSGLVG